MNKMLSAARNVFIRELDSLRERKKDAEEAIKLHRRCIDDYHIRLEQSKVWSSQVDADIARVNNQLAEFDRIFGTPAGPCEDD